MTTLVNYFDKMKPKQKQYLLNAVKKNIGGYRHLHMGLLPFLDVNDAYSALLPEINKLQGIEDRTNHERFAREIVSLFYEALPLTFTALVPTDKVVMQLSDKKVFGLVSSSLRGAVSRTQFTISMRVNFSWRDNCYVSLKRINPNHWQVETVKHALNRVTTYFAENLR